MDAPTSPLKRPHSPADVPCPGRAPLDPPKYPNHNKMSELYIKRNVLRMSQKHNKNNVVV